MKFLPSQLSQISVYSAWSGGGQLRFASFFPESVHNQLLTRMLQDTIT